MNCPNCGDTMLAQQYEGMSIQTCEGCGGEFVDAAALAAIIEKREARFDPEQVEALEDCRPVFGVPDEESGRTLSCPACDNTMKTLNYATDTGVFVDRCPVCGGVWLDSSELEQIQCLLERWQDEAPGQISSIADDLAAAREQAAQVGRGAFKGSRFSFVNAVLNKFLDAA
jgi:Zn-finger nucleic acid-binding protein